jgi:hypothetical protein
LKEKSAGASGSGVAGVSTVVPGSEKCDLITRAGCRGDDLGVAPSIIQQTDGAACHVSAPLQFERKNPISASRHFEERKKEQ